MGTRNLTMVIKDGQPRIAQYGQWDGYPEGQGLTALAFLQNADLEHFKSQLDKCRLHSNYKDLPENNLDNRDYCAEILQLVNDSDQAEIHLYNESSFAKDSLFCEWAYVIDLDKNVLEVYEGFNKSPLTEAERFFYLQEKNGDDDYYPVRHVISFPLNELPSKEDFVNKIKYPPVEF